ncbi:MAG TPA: BREX system P-loop protein BrxC, partial [Polyangiaceae bacterium]|nr:BREX system P-loop protein BrxC [Polyangiaceae bacterium]
EHIHSAVLRECQKRFGYSTNPAVADFELSLELEGQYPAFLAKAKEVLGQPWSKSAQSRLAADHFSEVMHHLQPDRYQDPMAWFDSRAGSHLEKAKSAEDVAVALGHMLTQRFDTRHLFIVIDEVSQYVHDNYDRMLSLQSLVAALGDRHRGRVWLLGTGQQKLDDDAADATAMPKLKARFPTHLRVHLSSANIRDVVHRRLLRKRRLKEGELRELFQRYRSDLALYAYQGGDVTEQDFVDVYPMLPGHIDLLMSITTGLRTRSTRVAGDSHEIRGLLQLLGDLFREHRLANREIGDLVSLDKIYDVQYSALAPDVQTTLTRALDLCHKEDDEVGTRVVKAVALLELIREQQKTDTELIARCLYQRLGQGSEVDAIDRALNKLRTAGLLGYSEKTGYKIQSSAGQEWQVERDRHGVGPERISAHVQEALARHMADVDKVKLGEMALPWRALFSDGLSQQDARIKDERKHTVLTVSFHFQLAKGSSNEWVQRSAQEQFRDRLLWVAGDIDAASDAARELDRSRRMIERYGNRQSSLGDEQQRLLIEERNREETGIEKLGQAVEAAFLAGHFYFRGSPLEARELGSNFASALATQGTKVVRQLYPNPVTVSVSEKDLAYMFLPGELSAPPRVFARDQLGLLEQDGGRFEVTCSGQVPQDVLRFVCDNAGVNGSTLLEHFGSPPFGYTADVVRACLVGLLRGGKIQVSAPGLGELTSVQDPGARELVQDRNLRKAELYPKKDTSIDARGRNTACKLFETQFGDRVARDNDSIADAVAKNFAGARERLTLVEERLRRVPRGKFPSALEKLGQALENCRRKRQVEPTVKALISHLAPLTDGLDLLRRLETDLTDEALKALREAADVGEIVVPQLAGQIEEASYAAHAQAIQEQLASDRPWNGLAELTPHVRALRELYQQRRAAILEKHQAEVERSLGRLKRTHGFDALDVDQRELVLRYVRDG